MNKRLLILLIPVLGFTSCFKNDKNECIPLEVKLKAPDAEISALKGYLTGNGITTEQDPRGFFYSISPMGTGAKPNTTDWGTEAAGMEGTLHTEINGEVVRKNIPTLKGNYYDLFDGIYKSITQDTVEPVTAEDGVNTMKIIDAAIASSAKKQVIQL